MGGERGGVANKGGREVNGLKLYGAVVTDVVSEVT